MREPLQPATGVRARSRAWMIGFPALLGAVMGGLGGALWWQVAGPGGLCNARDNNDCIGYLFLAPFVLLLGLGISWAVLAWATNAWVAPTVTLGGSAAAGYCLAIYQSAIPGDDPAPPLTVALIWAACYGAVAFACLPRLPRVVRGAVVAVLLAPALVYLVL